VTAGLAILAADSSTRAGTDKVSADLGGRPVLVWSLAAATASGTFDEIIVVAPPGCEAAVRALATEYAIRVISGGATRTAPPSASRRRSPVIRRTSSSVVTPASEARPPSRTRHRRAWLPSQPETARR